MANGGETHLVRGFMGEVVEAMDKAGFMNVGPDSWRTRYHSWSKSNPEGYKLILDQMADKAGVKVRFMCVMEADVDSPNRRVGEQDAKGGRGERSLLPQRRAPLRWMPLTWTT